MKQSEMNMAQIKVYRTLAGSLICKCGEAEASSDVVRRELPKALPYQALVIASQLDELRALPTSKILVFPGLAMKPLRAEDQDEYIDPWVVWELEVASDEA